MASELYDQVQEIDQRVSDLETVQNEFPVTQEAIDAVWLGLLNNKIDVGTVQLTAGTATVTDDFCSTSSYVFLTVQGTPHLDSNGKPAMYGVSINNGSFTINGSQSDDYSVLQYLIIYATS